MAERPRLKETDEILYSVAKKRRQPMQPVILPTDVLPPPIAKPGDEKPPAGKRGGSRKQAAKTKADTARDGGPGAGEGSVDRNPLDFGKYELKPKRTRSKPAPVVPDDDFASPALVELVGSEQPAAASAAAPLAEEAPVFEPSPIPTPAPMQTAGSAAARKPILSSPEAKQAEVKAFEFEDWDERERKALAEEEAKEVARRVAEAAEEARAQAQKEIDQRRMDAAKAAEEHRDAEARRKMLEDERYRENALRHLSTQFEEEFSQQFERKKERRPKEKPSWVPEKEQKAELPLVLEASGAESLRRGPGRSPQPVRRPAEPLSPSRPEDESPQRSASLSPEDETGADDFFALFEQGVKEEEKNRTEDFRETLAQKFMRERERYLEELGIADQMEAERAERERLHAGETPFPEEPRRRLNLQIQPEMHLQEGETPPPVRFQPSDGMRPVTYSRTAVAEPQQVVLEDEIAMLFTGPDPDLLRAGMETSPLADRQEPPAKKTAEQMLLELGEQTKRRAVEKPLKAKERGNTQFRFHFKSLGEEENGAEDGAAQRRLSPLATARARIIALSATAGVLVLALLFWGVSSLLNSGDFIAAPGDGVSAADGTVEENREVYQSYTASHQTPVKNVTVKRTGVTIGNLTVAESVVVDELATVAGPITLNNLIVDDMIYVQSSGNNELDLVDVRANRIVINNEQQTVTIRVSGNTDVASVEARTGVVIEQGELSGDAGGIQTLTVKNENAGEELSFAVNGASVQFVNTLGAAVGSFESAAVETMTADGDLTLSGSGKVQTLSAGISAGQGAGDVVNVAPLNLLIKGVDVGHLNLRSAATANISSYVDSMAVSHPVLLGGNGTIASLVINEEFGNGRLSAEILGVSVQQLTTNAESIIFSNGSSTINTLTANASTYALGNKVNMLVANADGVIFENAPDFVRTGQDAPAPQSKADNPQLDYTAGSTGESAGASDGAPVSGSCDHGEEYGGFRQGDGSRENPFLVETPAMLAHVTEHPGSHFIQGNDINLADDSSYVGGFPMIGAAGVRFSGSYDGKGYAIKNLIIYAEQENVGLFAENTGSISNVRIDSGTVSGGSESFVGGVVGLNYQGGSVTSCSNGASVEASASSYAGGVVGYNYGGKVHDCYNTGKVNGGGYAGGLVGMNRQNASVTGSYNVGLIEATGDRGAIAGGNEDAVITNCFYLLRGGDELEGAGSGGGNVVAMDTAELSSSQMAATLAAGDDLSLWQRSETESYPYPVHKRPSASSAPSAEVATTAPEEDFSSNEDLSDGSVEILPGDDDSMEGYIPAENGEF